MQKHRSTTAALLMMAALAGSQVATANHAAELFVRVSVEQTDSSCGSVGSDADESLTGVAASLGYHFIDASAIERGWGDTLLDQGVHRHQGLVHQDPVHQGPVRQIPTGVSHAVVHGVTQDGILMRDNLVSRADIAPGTRVHDQQRDTALQALEGAGRGTTYYF